MNTLKIISTPTKLSMTSQRARSESRLPDSEVGIIRNPRKLNMKSDHIKVDIDTSYPGDSLGFRIARGLMKNAASTGLKTASDATVQYPRVDNQMMQIQDGVTVSGTIKNQTMAQTNVVTGIAFIPSVGPDISWEPANLFTDFAPIQPVFDPQVQEPATRYTPDELSVNAEQYLKVEIEHTGDPMYVSPSVNPAGNEGPQ